jgi:hypothetical protein
MVLSSLPQRSSWGSGWWMCTWKTTRRQTPPTMQRYIAARAQRRDSNISTNWGMVDDGAGFFSRSSSNFYWRLLTKTAKQLARRVGGATAEMDLWRGGQKLAGGENKSGDMTNSKEGETWQWQHRGGVFPFIAQRSATVMPTVWGRD